jgi:hypothetical protein
MSQSIGGKDREAPSLGIHDKDRVDCLRGDKYRVALELARPLSSATCSRQELALSIENSHLCSPHIDHHDTAIRQPCDIPPYPFKKDKLIGPIAGHAPDL